MAIPFSVYATIKDHYCCWYLGNSPEYVIALKLLKPQIQKQLPIHFWIACPDNFQYLLENENNVILSSQMKEMRHKISYIRELRNDFSKHSILTLIKESNLDINPIKTHIEKHDKGLCIICPEGIPPVKSMTQKMVEKAIYKAKVSGYSPLVLGSDIHHSLDILIRPLGKDKFSYIENACWIIGVENEYTLLGATNGIKTSLVNTGIGGELFKLFVPFIDVFL